MASDPPAGAEPFFHLKIEGHDRETVERQQSGNWNHQLLANRHNNNTISFPALSFVISLDVLSTWPCKREAQSGTIKAAAFGGRGRRNRLRKRPIFLCCQHLSLSATWLMTDIFSGPLPQRRAIRIELPSLLLRFPRHFHCWSIPSCDLTRIVIFSWAHSDTGRLPHRQGWNNPLDDDGLWPQQPLCLLLQAADDSVHLHLWCCDPFKRRGNRKWFNPLPPSSVRPFRHLVVTFSQQIFRTPNWHRRF